MGTFSPTRTHTMAAALKVLVVFCALLTFSAFAEEEAKPAYQHTEEEIKEAREVFDEIDLDKDGYITQEEILKMEDAPEPDEIKEFFDLYDKEKDGKVDFQEVLDADAQMRMEEE